MPTTRPGSLSAASPSAPLLCFLVEDSEVIRNNLVATLEEMLSVRVVGFAESESEALSWMARPGSAADLVIVDIFLKSGSGLGVLAKAAELMPQSSCIVLTNFATADMRRRCAALGADRVFDKSSELDELLAYCGSLASH